MGGWGSGSRSRFAPKTDEFHKLDLADFKRHWFEHGFNGTCRWSRGDRETGSIGYMLRPDHMQLRYSVTRQGEKVSIDERFDFDFTEQPFGGMRRWIICRSCEKRCRVLYGGAYFRCRKCYEATYPSQYEQIRIPGLSRAERVRDRLGGAPGFIHAFPDKPKGMHWQTYRRLQAKDWDTTDSLDAALSSQFKTPTA
jgi:hypothetical protein